MDAMNVILDAGLNLHTKHPEILNAATNAVASQIDAVRKEGRKEGIAMERARLGKIRFIECEIDGIKRAIKICESPENRFSDASHFLVVQLKLEIEELEKEIAERRQSASLK